jgi:hypothetical protein
MSLHHDHIGPDPVTPQSVPEPPPAPADKPEWADDTYQGSWLQLLVMVVGGLLTAGLSMVATAVIRHLMRR